MKITLKRTEEQVELVKAMASKDRNVAYEAQLALAEFIGPLLAKVINNAPTLSNLFTPFEFNSDDSPSIPLDLYYDITAEDYIKVYTQTVPGGLPSNTVAPTQSEMKFTTYRLDSAIDFDKRYASRSRLDVVSKSFTRLAQEILLQQERTSANLILGTLVDQGREDDNGATGLEQTLLSTDNGRLVLHDFNRLLTRAKRISPSWSGGTPDSRSRGITDLIVSPEVVQSLREMAYNPIATRNPDGTDISDTSATGIPATDSMREAIYGNGGIPEFYGVSIQEIYELGESQKYTGIYNTLNTLKAGKKDLVIGLDKSRESLMRAVAVDSVSGSSFNLLVDDQYVTRQQRIGYYGAMEEGRMILDSRAVLGIEV